jgi:hypothetical protein
MSMEKLERRSRNNSTFWRLILSFIVLLLFIVALGACAPEETPPPTETEVPPSPVPPTATSPPPPTATPLPDQSEFRVAWESGPHANNYDLGKGPNTYCSRCHSPQNWDPTSKPDRPPNCITCKFATDEELRIATTMDFVEEADWFGITCESCHVVDENGIAGELSWLNTATGEYEEINVPNELCGKCHANTSGLSVSGGTGVTHAISLGGSAHLNWAGEWPQEDRPQFCSDCHDPHSTEPKQCVDCHEDIPTSDTHMQGLNAIMLDKVTCMACHDASGMEVGPHPDEEEGGLFVTIVSSVGRAGPTTEYLKSHSIQWAVSCDRCHFDGNVWELPVLTADGQVPEPTPEATAVGGT